MQSLNCGKGDIYIFSIGSLKIIYFFNGDHFTAECNSLRKKIFRRKRIQEVFAGFVYDVGAVHKEEKVPVALFVKVKDRPRHNQGFPAPCCHVKKELCGLLPEPVIGKIIQEAAEGLVLIWPEFKSGI